MEYAMLTTLIPKEYEEEFRNDSKGVMQDAANALQWNIYRGLSANLGKTIPMFNVLPCQSFPQYHKRAFIPEFDFEKSGKNLPFCNIKVIRNNMQTASIKKALVRWCRSTKDSKTLFVYTISQPFLSAVNCVKKRFPELKVCGIVADLPNMSNLSSKRGILLKLYSDWRAKVSYSLISSVDCFVLLTEHMAEYMNLKQPYCVMEGIATDKENFVNPDYNNSAKTVFYAGTLHRKFGVLDLLEAFKTIDSQEYRLVICGVGDSETEIKAASEKDKRIKFFGQLSRDEVLKLQSTATVLVNPRKNNEEFTRYSFPSKNLEYLSSGIPFIAYKLDGIPDEYDKYILYVKDNELSSLSEKIIEVCELSDSKRKAIGVSAKEFVCANKNYKVQTKKILNLINETS